MKPVAAMFSHCEALTQGGSFNVQCEAENKTNSKQSHQVQQNFTFSWTSVS